MITEKELVNILREYHENNMIMSFTSFLNTLKACKDIDRYIVEQSPYDIRSNPCYCIETYKRIDEEEIYNPYSHMTNIWIYFIDEDNIMLKRYYPMRDNYYLITDEMHDFGNIEPIVLNNSERIVWTRGES